MKIEFFTVSFVLCLNLVSMSQSSVQGKLDYQRGEKVAAIIELPYSPDIVEGAIKNRLESATVKEERLRGMQVFKGGRLTPTDGEVVDFYFKVDRKGRRDDSTSVVYLILGRPGENVALRTLNDDFRVQDAKKFLNSFVPVAAAYKLETDITRQDDLVKKSERSLNNLLEEQKDLEEKISDLQERLALNKRNQEAQSAQLQQQRSQRDLLVSKRTAAPK